MRICLDPGHGGTDPGAIGAGVYEKNIVLEVCNYIKNILVANGIEVYMTRSVDKTQSVTEKARYANNTNSDYFISVHCNAATNTSAKGTEILVYNGEQNINKFANTVLNSLLELGFVNRGIKTRPDLCVLNSTKMPAMLIELAFITNVSDRGILVNKKLQIATKICEGIFKYLNIKQNNNDDSKEEEEEMVIYKTYNDIPEWGKPTIKKLIDKGVIVGDGKGTLNLSEIEVRIYVVHDREGLYDIDLSKLK